MSDINEIFENKEQEFDWFPYADDVMMTDIYERTYGINEDTIYNFEIYSYEVTETEYKEDLKEAMNETFSSVYEKLCGYEIPEISTGTVSGYIEELNKKCEVMTTEIDLSRKSEIAARIERCLDENGCIIAIVDNDIWSGETSVFIDSGLRTVQVLNIDDDRIEICDPASPDISAVISVGKLAEQQGVLLEVLK